jgi:hypothetical protein
MILALILFVAITLAVAMLTAREGGPAAVLPITSPKAG